MYQTIGLLLMLLFTNVMGNEQVESSSCKHKMVKILYGKPSREKMKLADEEKIHLGGCMVSEDAPRYYCVKCKKSFKTSEK